jgi:hypothetical protein
VKGMARHDEGFIVILNLGHLLSEEYLDIIATAMDRNGDGGAGEATADPQTDTRVVVAGEPEPGPTP